MKSIADFLLHLFQDRKLQPSTIDGYSSTIADKLENSPINVGKDENLARLLDIETDLRVRGASPLEPLPGVVPVDNGSIRTN